MQPLETESFATSTQSVVMNGPDHLSEPTGGTAKEDAGKENIQPHGSMMLNIEEWIQAEKLPGTTNAGLLWFSALVLVLILTVGRAFMRKDDTFFFRQHKYKVIGLVVQPNQDGKNLYYPVYEEIK